MVQAPRYAWSRQLSTSDHLAPPAWHPPPKLLTTSLSTAPSAPLLVELGDAHGAAFNGVHVSAFWVSLGRLVRTDPAQRSWVQEHTNVLEGAHETTLRLLPTLGAREVANVAHGAASAGLVSGYHPWPLFWSHLAAAAQPVLPAFRTLELKDLSWALATVGALHGPLAGAIAAEALERLEEMEPEEMAVFAWSFTSGDAAQLEESSDTRALLQGVAHAAAQSDLTEFDATSLATAVWALARTDLGESSTLFFRHVAAHLPARVQATRDDGKRDGARRGGRHGGRRGQPGARYALAPENVATLAWGLGKAEQATPALLELLAEAAVTHPLSSYDAYSLNTLVMPYVMCSDELHQTSTTLLTAVAAHAARAEVIETFGPSALLALARGYATALGAGRVEPVPALFGAIARRAVDVLPQCTERELSLLPWAFVRAGGASASGRDRHALFVALAIEAAPRLVEFRALGLVAMVWSYARHMHGEAAADERDLFREIAGDDDHAIDSQIADDPQCAHLLDMLAEQTAGRRHELSEHDAQTVETCFLRLGRPSPLGEREAFGMTADGAGVNDEGVNEWRPRGSGRGHGGGQDVEHDEWDDDDEPRGLFR